jgi:two-component system cell cycle sensor histidine kinase/response regulator CckA
MERTDFEQWKAKEVARLLALVETERRYYQEMVAVLPVPLVVLSSDRSIISANRAFRQTFGVRMEDLRRKTIEQMLPSPQLVERIRDVHTHGTESRDLFIELDQRSLRVAIVPIRNWDDEGEAETLLMIQDVTAFGTPSVAPAAASDADIPAIVWQADGATLVFKSVSGAAERLLGFPVSHWLETDSYFSERIHPEDRAATMEFYQSAIERGGDATAEFRAASATGKVIWCRETIRVTGNTVVTGVLTDITQRKQLELQLLTAERSDALYGLASRLAHDLNNPLMIITGYGEEMLHTLQPEDPLRGDVEQILGATERISGITGQLLGYTRRLANSPQSVDLGAMVARLEPQIAEAAGESATVEISPVVEPVWASADPEQLESIILALVFAAREDGEKRSRVSISCRNEAISEQIPGATLGAGLYACLTVNDEGWAFDAEQRAAIFESVLGKDSAAPALTRAYATIRAWGGDIAVSSETHGSVYTIYLPQGEPIQIQAVAEPVAPAVEPPVEPPAPEPAEQLRETILLVEDEAGIRALVRKILRRERYNVLEAGSAEEALSIVDSQGHIDLLLTDMMLPGMGGRELAEAMRLSVAELKVLYVSGYTEDESVRAGAFPPGSKFLQKPFTLSVLVGKVREALDAEIPA